MNVVVTASMTYEQKRWLELKNISLSALIQKVVNDLIDKEADSYLTDFEKQKNIAAYWKKLYLEKSREAEVLGVSK